MIIATLNEPVAIFLAIMTVVLVTQIVSERVRLPGIVGIILGGMLIGPHGLNLLSTDYQMEFLATIGLIYLMFSAGLEVDIHQFTRVRGRAMLFGLLTFFFPLVLGMGLGRLLGMSWLGAVLLGSAFSSHTLIAFPILTRLGVLRNEAVAVTIGATVLTDIGAFLVLAIVLGVQQGELKIGFFVQLFVLLTIFVLLLLFVLPRLGKLFFRRFSERTIEFQFVLVILFVAAFFAEKIGVNEVIGAFLAGLAINITLPHKSAVTGHVLFLGESVFIPIFLLYSGMMTNPLAFVENRQTILVAVGVTLVAYLSKFIAAWITGKVFHYSREELMTAYGLSHAQAAVTVPTLIIGLQQGLFTDTVFNAAILMILLTSITSPLLVQRFGQKLQETQSKVAVSPLFSRILVPIANPQNQEKLITFASILASAEKGKLMVLNVVRDDNLQFAGVAQQQKLLEKIPQMLKDPLLDVQFLPRVDHTVAQGILHAAAEQNASLIVMGWREKTSLHENIIGTVLNDVIRKTTVPVLAGQLNAPINSIRRVVLIISPESMSPLTIRRTLDVVILVTQTINVPLLILTDQNYISKVKTLMGKLKLVQEYKMEALRGSLIQNVLETTTALDLIILPSSGAHKRFLSNLGGLPERLAAGPDANVVVLHYNH